jgi:hypothetical protein
MPMVHPATSLTEHVPTTSPTATSPSMAIAVGLMEMLLQAVYRFQLRR